MMATVQEPVKTVDLETLAQQVLDLTRGRVDQAEVFGYDSTSTPVDFEANRLKSLETKEARGLSLRVIKNGRTGFASTTRLDDPASLVDMAVELSPFGAQAKFELPAKIEPAPVDVFDAAVGQLQVDHLVSLGQEMIDRVRTYDARILCDAGVHRSAMSVLLLNSRGGRGTYQKSSYALTVVGQLIRGEDMLMHVFNHESSCGVEIDNKAVADGLIRKFEQLKDVATVRSGRLPVIFHPWGVLRHLLGLFTAALSGKSVLQGNSALSDKLGQQAFDPHLTLVDDSTISGKPGSSPFDDEGVQTRRLALIENGRVNHFYYDLQTAGLAGTQSTGNGYRSPETLPSPSTGLLTVEPGDTSLEDMISGIDEGLLVESMTGSAGNVYSGDFAGTVHIGYKIEKGKLAGRVKDTAVGGNIFADMKQLGAISRTTQWAGGSAKLPYILFDELGVSTKS
jgi:PmbA protein